MRLVYLASFLVFFVGCGTADQQKTDRDRSAKSVKSVETTDHVAEVNVATNTPSDECTPEQLYSCPNCPNCPNGGENCPQNCPNCPNSGAGGLGNVSGGGNCPLGDLLGQLGGGGGLPSGLPSGLPTGGGNCPLGDLLGQLGPCP